MFPLLALIPPTAIAMVTHSLELLVGITGSYAGAGIQYVVPAALVFQARKQVISIPVYLIGVCILQTNFSLPVCDGPVVPSKIGLI